jgi:hypothetical protein
VSTNTAQGLQEEEQEEKASSSVPENELSRTQQEKVKKARRRASVVVRHVDIIKDDFWERRPWILSGKPGNPFVVEDRSK